MAERFVDVVIRAKDQVAAGINSAQAKLDTFGRNAAKSTPAFSFDQLAIGALKFSVAIQAAQGGLSLVRSLMGALRGDSDEVDRALRQLPLGLGTVAGIALDIRKSMSGVAEETEAAAERASRLAAALAQAKAEAQALKGIAAARETLGDILQDVSSGLQVQEASGRDRERLKLLEQQRKERQELERRIADAAFRSQADPRQVAQLREQALGQLDERHEAEREELRVKLIQDRDKAIRDSAERTAKAREAAAEQLAQTESEIRQAQLRAAGDLLAAEEEQIRESFRRRMQDATDAERERLAVLRQLELDAAAQREADRRAADAKRLAAEQVRAQRDFDRTRPTEAIILSNRFQGLAAQRNDREAAMERGFDRVVDEVRKVADWTRQQVELIRRAKPQGGIVL